MFESWRNDILISSILETYSTWETMESKASKLIKSLSLRADAYTIYCFIVVYERANAHPTGVLVVVTPVCGMR